MEAVEKEYIAVEKEAVTMEYMRNSAAAAAFAQERPLLDWQQFPSSSVGRLRAEGALKIRIYMRCGYCSDNAIDCGQKERREVPIRRRPVASPSASSTRGSSSSSQPRVDLVCPYREKDEAKKLGARWDPGAKTWFVPPGKPLAPFTKWLPVSQGVGAAAVVPASAQGGAAPSQITCGDLWKDLARVAATNMLLGQQIPAG